MQASLGTSNTTLKVLEEHPKLILVNEQGPNLTSLDAMPDEDLRHHVSDDTFGHSFSETFHNAEDDWFDAGEDQTSHPPHSEDPRRGNDGMESIDMVDEIFAKVDASGGGALALLDAWASA